MGLLEWTLLVVVLVVLAVFVKRSARAGKFIEQAPNQSSGLIRTAGNEITQSEPITETALLGLDGKKLLSIAFLDEITFKQAQLVALPTLDIDRLSPLMQLVPDVATNAKVAGANLYRVVIAGEMLSAKGIPDGLRPVAQAANGKISEMAVLYETGALSSLVSSGLVLNIASMALAQKHLADISTKLEALQSSVTSIAWFQNAERRSSIEGAIDYFQEISDPMVKGSLPLTYQHQIEFHYAELKKTENHLQLDIKHRAHDTIPAMKDAGQWGSEVFRKAIDDETTQLEEVMAQWFLCIRARLQAWCLQALVPGNDEAKRARLENIRAAVVSMKSQSGLLSAALTALNSKIDEINSKVEFAETLRSHRKSMREKVADRANGLWNAVSDTETMIIQAGDITKDAAGPLHIGLRVVDGHVVEARAIGH